MHLDVISTSEGLSDLRDEWEALERSDTKAPYYVTHRYVSAWWAAYADDPDRELHVVRVTNNGRCVGIAPLVVWTREVRGKTLRVLRFTGTGDYNAPLIDPDASAGAVCKLVREHLETGERWDRVHLGNIPATSAWAHQLFKSGLNPKLTVHVECPYVDMAKYDDLAAFEKRHLPAQLRNRRNKLYREAEPTFRVWHGNEEDILGQIAQLHRLEKEYLIAQKARTERYSLFEDPARMAHVRALFTGTDDVVTFGLTTPKDGLIGYITCFRYGGTVLSWNIAYHPDYEQYRIGKVLHYEAIAHLFRAGGVDRFDFGAGRYPWKFEWTDDFDLTYQLRFDVRTEQEQPEEASARQREPQKDPGPAPAQQAAPKPAAAPSLVGRVARRVRRGSRSVATRLRPPVIWYVPHPDDETIFMGGSIGMHRDRRNILVVLTRGGGSGARKVVNRKLEQQNLNRARFMRARVRELRAAAARLGVHHHDVLVHDLPDGGVEVSDVHEIVAEMAGRFPRAQHRTMSFLDPHADHATAGEALRKAYESGVVKDCLFHLPVSLVDDELGSHVPLDEPAVAAKRAALREYELWRPAKGRFAIGAHSVSRLIREQAERPVERVHGPTYGD